MNTLAIGDKITIRQSKLLAKNGNDMLVNKTGIVTRMLKIGNNLIGVYADVRIMRKIKNYYIPSNSIESADDINKTRVLGILKSTIL